MTTPTLDDDPDRMTTPTNDPDRMTTSTEYGRAESVPNPVCQFRLTLRWPLRRNAEGELAYRRAQHLSGKRGKSRRSAEGVLKSGMPVRLT